MQEVLRLSRALQRPVILIAPLIQTHDKNPHWLPGELVLRAFKEIVIPLENRVVLIEFGSRRPEIDIADLASRSGMPANDHQEMLATLRGFVSPFCLNPFVVAQRPALKNVVPGGDR